ncbi:hypothetical protein AB8613_23825 [Vibrio sp. BS-M-Sm-2]|uniref:hypothetical protein n=1 Tax=Vibrio sp. BS-M-Sm-2 TaxID=3241167 RepID=UPI003558935B
MKKIILSTLIGSIMSMSGVALAAEGDDMTVVTGDASKASFNWTGSVDGVVSGDGFTLTGSGGGPLMTDQELNITPVVGEKGTYQLGSKRAITVEAHALVEGAIAGEAADPEMVGGLIPNEVIWSLADVGFSNGEIDLDKSTMMFLLRSTDTTGASVGEEFPADDLVSTTGDNTVEVSFRADSVAGLTPGSDVSVSATVIATAGAIAPKP